MILGQNFKFLVTLCVVKMDLEMMSGDVLKRSEGHLHHVWRKGMLVWFPGPPLTLLFTSEGISLRLDSAKRYQKPFRGSHQGTTLTQCSQDRITLLAHLILLGTLSKGWLPQLVFYPRREFTGGQLY